MKNGIFRKENSIFKELTAGLASLCLAASGLAQTPLPENAPPPVPPAADAPAADDATTPAEEAAPPVPAEEPVDNATAIPSLPVAQPKPAPVTPPPAPITPSLPQPEGADEFLPPSYTPTRYSASGANSPFEREILPPVVETVEEKNELNEYKIVGIGKLRGKYMITLNHPKEGYLNVWDKESPDGIYVVSVSNGNDPRQAEVRIKQGTKEAVIRFDEKNLTSAPKGGAAPAPQARGATPRTAVPNRSNRGAVPTPNTRTNPGTTTQSNQALINHLKNSTQQNAQNPAASSSGSSSSTPAPKRRRVVLPPKR